MKRIVCPEYGPPDLLTVVDAPVPEPRDGEVAVRVAACGVGYIDALLVSGGYQVKVPTPFTPGGEIAGIVTSTGDSANAFAPGDRVAAVTGIGGLAEHVVLHEGRLRRLPADMSFAEAAALGLDYATAGYALCERADLQAGESLLVLGAAGGVGGAAVDVGKALGATVIAAASSDEKLQHCAEAGADHLVNYSEVDLKVAVRELFPKGVDVVVDPVGGRFSEPALRATAWRGRYLVVGFATGDIASVPLNIPLLRGCAVLGVDWRVFSTREPAEAMQVFARLDALYGDGLIHPEPSRTYTFDRVAEAFREVLTRERVGKSVVIFDAAEADQALARS